MHFSVFGVSERKSLRNYQSKSVVHQMAQSRPTFFLHKQLGCSIIAIRWTPTHFHMIINICGESVDKFGVRWTCRWQVFFSFLRPLWRTLKIKLPYFQAMMSGWRTFTYVSTLVQFSFLSFGVFTAWAEGWWQEKRCFDTWHSSWLQSNLIIK